MPLDDCINKLREVSGRPKKFAHLKRKMDRLQLTFGIQLGKIREMELGFDNHKNHNRPHIHINTKDKNIGKISIGIDNGEILHDCKKRMNRKVLKEIKAWVLKRSDCLKLIYENIQNCKSVEDFQPLINAMNQFF